MNRRALGRTQTAGLPNGSPCNQGVDQRADQPQEDHEKHEQQFVLASQFPLSVGHLYGLDKKSDPDDEGDEEEYPEHEQDEDEFGRANALHTRDRGSAPRLRLGGG